MVSYVSVNNFSTTLSSVFLTVLEIPFICILPISRYLIYVFKLDLLITERSACMSKRNFNLFSSHKSVLSIIVSKLELILRLHSWSLSERQPVSWSRQSMGCSQAPNLCFPSLSHLYFGLYSYSLCGAFCHLSTY